MPLSQLCRSKGILAGAGGSGAVALTIIFVFLIPGMNANADSIVELQITQSTILTHLENDQKNAEEFKQSLEEFDNKLDRLTIITCKTSDSSLCN